MVKKIEKYNEITIYLDNTGEIISSFSIKYWTEWINEFVREKAYIYVQKEQEYYEETLFLADLLKRIKKKETIIIIAVDERKKEIAGVCEIVNHQNNISFGLVVKKEYRNKGIGKKLLKYGIQYGKKIFKPKTIYINYAKPNKIAEKLYKSLGFKELCTFPNKFKYYNKIVDEVWMILEDKK